MTTPQQCVKTDGLPDSENIVMVDLPNQNEELENFKTSASPPSYEDIEADTPRNSSKQSRCRNETVCLPCISGRTCLERVWKAHRRRIKPVLQIMFFVLFIVYLGFAFDYEFGDEHSIRLLVMALILVAVVAWKFCKKKGTSASNCLSRCPTTVRVMYTLAGILVLAAIIAFLIMDVALKRPACLVSVLGISVIVIFMFIGSENPRKVVWRPICWGLLLQFVFAVLVLRTAWGRAAFQWMAARMTDYMDFTDSGAMFVFGNNFREHFFAFRVMSTIVFFSATISVLYFLGVLQVLIRAVAAVMNVTMETGPLETFHAAVNIFCGWAESLMVIRPFMDSMSLPELHAVMTNGFSTVAGSTVAAYILYGVSANHLISASFMSAPAALAMSKLFYPSGHEARSKISVKDIPRQGTGVVDAASQGAVAAIGVVSHILVTVIAFISLLAFVNATLEWFGARVGLAPPHYPPLTFQLICSYVLWPVALLIGVPAHDCRIVARMLGIKVFINEFIAYSDLGKVRANRMSLEDHVARNGSWRMVDGIGDEIEMYGVGPVNTTLIGGVLLPRSEMLATYALCGFSDLVALGMMTAALSTVAPARRADILKVAPRALISGVVACLLTASMAGLVAEA